MDGVRAQLRDIFEAPDAMVHLTATGTAANVLILGTMANPWDTIFCTAVSHINTDECNAPEFYSGAKLTLVDAVDAKMTPDALRAAIEATGVIGVHNAQRGPVSITQVTERGTIYALDEIRALTAVAREYGLKVHMDGARFTNALVHLGCTPAEMTWKAGIDAVSFGGTKNGLMGAEACIFFDPAKQWEFELRRKRGAHLFSKHRFLSAQMQAYLANDLWLDLASRANASSERLRAELAGHDAVRILYNPRANMTFFEGPRRLHQKLMGAGAVYYVEDGDVANGPADGILTGRLVTDWSMTDAGVDQFLGLLRA
jgi:threonine aldolase